MNYYELMLIIKWEKLILLRFEICRSDVKLMCFHMNPDDFDVLVNIKSV